MNKHGLSSVIISGCLQVRSRPPPPVSPWLKLMVEMLRAGRSSCSSRPPHQLACLIPAPRLVQQQHQRARLMLLLQRPVEVLPAASWPYRQCLLLLAAHKQSQHQKRAAVRGNSEQRALRPLMALPSTLELQPYQTTSRPKLHLGATRKRTTDPQNTWAPITRQSPLQRHQRCR